MLFRSRWKRIVTNPAKAANTYLTWWKATPAEKAAAKYTAQNSGQVLAVYAALIAANAGLNAYLNGDDKEKNVNLTDPLSSDWMKFKAGDRTLDLSGGILSTMRFISTLINQSRIAYSKFENKRKGLSKTPQEVDYINIMKQLRGKAAPFSGLAADILTGVNGIGKPLPFSEVKPRKGEKAYTYPEFIGEQFSPIFIAEGLRTVIESMHKRGVSEAEIRDILNGIAVGTISGSTGAKIGYAPEHKSETSSSESSVKVHQHHRKKRRR